MDPSQPQDQNEEDNSLDKIITFGRIQTERLDEAVARIETLVGELTEAQERIQTLTTSLDLRQDEANQLSDKVHALDVENKRYFRGMVHLGMELLEHKGGKEEAQNQVNAQNKEIAELRERIYALGHEVRDLRYRVRNQINDRSYIQTNRLGLVAERNQYVCRERDYRGQLRYPGQRESSIRFTPPKRVENPRFTPPMRIEKPVRRGSSIRFTPP
ncbi:hypothetical protein V8F20_008285 [Naviculisporaceae sp. PSN 640]